ncbi:eukaryotic translation initiation factor 3 subunit B-like isoform X1 [Pistacia vera]|uniref:eukaryotic translation initiation factor 3 subunit B-like isoform X1 n=1 Tax=Pistacia vera TaxID=55513 RepID=UPI001262F71B|nr:eukaryotic translation initiation factor 3 subunit B-like isoform X1 [Pistacia vera]XP_031279735.1 eukaryotic translation initiation factor 3 subunit B-like isoform X1 [Pistacia vera]
MGDVLIMNQTEELASRLGIDLTQVDLDSVHVPPGENCGIISDDDDVYEDDQQELDSGFGNIIVVDNLPVVPREKFEKLEGVIRKIYSQIGVIKEDGLWMPVDPETQKTLGYCFIEYNTPQEAELAKEKTNGYKLDKAHIFAVNMFDDFDKFMKVPNEWAPPEFKPYTPGVILLISNLLVIFTLFFSLCELMLLACISYQENLQQWLTDEKARDQFVIRAGTDTEVLWNDARHLKPEPVYKRTYWTESFVQWSPLGTYLATVHRQGAAVWGGAATFNRLMRYAHPQVKLIDFSPGEKYLVTYSSQEPSNPRDANRVVLNIFDVRTGKVMRDFKGSADEYAVGGTGGVAGVSWPVFRWGGGKDKYFAKLGKNAISVYETETFTLIDKKSLKVENVMDFSWSPTDPILALFVPELGGGNQPARVSLVQIPSKEELRQKNLFSVSDCKMYWQSNGEYLAVKVDRYTKTKKSTYTGFELFRIKERDIPIEVLELDNKNDKIIAFAWEPKGHRFAVIHGDSPRPDISFYTMKTANNTSRVSKLTTLKGKQANALFWSPSGRFIVLAGLKGFNGQLEFYNVDELETMATGEHFMATDIEWDPTGRYVATAVTSVHEMENGFNIWSFNGKLLYRTLKDHFFQFLWRPRPPSFLSPEKEEEIAKNLKKYSKKYEAEDQDVSLQLSEQERERRRALKDEWEKWVNKWKRLHEEDKLERQGLRDGEASDEEEEYEAKEIEVEEVLDVSEEVVFFD